MGLRNGAFPPLFSLAWQQKYAPVVARTMVAEIVVYEEGDKEYNVDTDTWSIPTTTILTSIARVQPIRSAYRLDVPGNDTSAVTVLFSVPLTDADLRPGQQCRVTSSPLNETLLSYQFVVSEVPDSSNPIERTFYCTLNQEVVV